MDCRLSYQTAGLKMEAKENENQKGKENPRWIGFLQCCLAALV